MNTYRYKTIWKLVLLFFAVCIGLFSLLYTQTLVKNLKAEERKKVELWAEATRQIINSSDNENLTFPFSIVEGNTTIPIILTNGADSIIQATNFRQDRINDTQFLYSRLARMKEKNEPIVIRLDEKEVQLIYYRDSNILRMLIYYPYVQLSVILVFILVSYLAFSSSRKAEQNQVWVGMSKETAHQLGTPTSSLGGWLEILQMKHPEIEISGEMARDVARLEKITERFSKIGSRPDLTTENIAVIVSQTIDYIRSRTSSKTSFVTAYESEEEVIIPVNAALFSWVIENVCKNAIDATEGKGEITISIANGSDYATIDVIDNGKGISKSAFKKIFKPGYTTKAHGWGLGLSLAGRIIEDYHNGRIFVRYSEPGKGTCIRIMMKKKVQ